MLERLRRKWYVILAALLLVVGAALFLIYLILGRWVENSDITLDVDGSVTYRSAGDVEQAMTHYQDAGCAKIITDKKDAPGRRVAIVFDNLAENSTNEKVLSVIKAHRISAAFSVPGIMAAENDEFLARLPAIGCSVAGSTLAEDASASSQTPSDLIESLVMTKNIIEGLVDKKVENVFLSGTPCSRNILKTVAACGYEHVIEPSNENLIDEKTFEDVKDVREYVSKLSGDTIIMIELDGPADVIKDEIPVYPDRPAIDKKSDTKAQEKEEEEEPLTIDEILEMLVSTLEDKEIEICSLEDLEVTDFDETWRGTDPAKAGKGAVIRNVITDRKEAALAIYGLPSNLEDVLRTLGEEGASATFFVTGKSAKAHPEELKTIRDSGCNIGNAGYEGISLRGKNAFDCYDEICNGADALEDLEASETVCYMPRVNVRPEEGLTPDDLFEKWMDGIRSAAAANGSKVIYPVKRDSIRPGDIVTIECRDMMVDINDVEDVIALAADSKLQIKTVDDLIGTGGRMSVYGVEEIRSLRQKNGGKKASVMNRRLLVIQKAVRLPSC